MFRHFAVLTALIACPSGRLTQAPVLPNIVLIYADDLGYGDLSCTGAKRIRTPHLDTLAREGARFTQFYSCASVCTPSRVGLLTGRMPIRTGLTRILNPGRSFGIDSEEITLAEALKARGYATAMVGKWHLGHLPPFLPTRNGFDSYFGVPYSNDTPPVVLLRNEQEIENPAVQGTLTRRYAEEAVRFLRASKGRPSFLYFAHTSPHVPLHASDAFRGKSPGGLYGDVVEELDWSVGEVVRAIRESGLAERTVVFFASDNGPWLTQGEHGGSAGPLRDGKTTLYEGGIRVPAIAWAPGRIAPGQVLTQPAITLDLFPTFLGLAGGRPASDRPYDGRDLWPWLTGRSASATDREFLFYWVDEPAALRAGRWKYFLPRKNVPAQLYDLDADPGEREDRIAGQPEVAARLSERARALHAEHLRGARPLKK